MDVSLITLATVTDLGSALGFTLAWYAVVCFSMLVSLYLWRRLEDRTYLFYSGYLGMVGMMSLTNHVMEAWFLERWGEHFVFLNNFMHLPYAFSYLLFVKCYFRVATQGVGWNRFLTGMQWAYGVAFLWWGVAFFLNETLGSEWAILSCNLVTLISSLILAGIATNDNRAGAKEFLYASLPLTVCSVVLVAQFLSEAGPMGPLLLAFRTGFILHVMVFLVALSVRYRDLRNQLEE